MRCADKYEVAKTEITSIYHENKGRYGYRRITTVLHDIGVAVRFGTAAQQLAVIVPPHFGQKKAGDLFSDFLLGVPLCERRVFSCKSSGQVDPM